MTEPGPTHVTYKRPFCAAKVTAEVCVLMHHLHIHTGSFRVLVSPGARLFLQPLFIRLRHVWWCIFISWWICPPFWSCSRSSGFKHLPGFCKGSAKFVCRTSEQEGAKRCWCFGFLLTDRGGGCWQPPRPQGVNVMNGGLFGRTRRSGCKQSVL